MTGNPHPVAVATAILANVLARMPTLEAMTAAPADNADPLDMGPDVTLPAIHMHILAQHIRLRDAQVTQAGLDLRIAQATSIGLAPENVGDAYAVYAGHVGEVMLRAFPGDHDEAVSMLIHAAAAILATKYEAEFAAHALEVGAAMLAGDIRKQFAPAGAVQ